MPGSREAYEQAMNAGHNAAWDQEWHLAVAAYGRAIREFPMDPEAHIHLGLGLFEIGRLEDALKIYSRASQLAKSDPIPLEKSADVLEKMGRLREAAQQYANVAEVYLGQRDLDKAIHNWERATRLTPGLIPIHIKLAQAYERIGDKKKAVFEYLTLAYNFKRLNDIDKATKVIQRALRLDKNNTQLMNSLRLLETGGDLLPPAGEATKRVDLREEVDARVQPDVIEDDPLGPLGEAMNYALGALAIFIMESSDGMKVAADALQAMEAQRQKMNDTAIAAYQRADSKLRQPAIKMNLGALLLQQGRANDAIKSLNEAVNHPQTAAGAYQGLGKAFLAIKKPKQGVRYLLQCIQAVDPTPSPSVETPEPTIFERIIDALDEITDENLAAMGARLASTLEGVNWKEKLVDLRRQLEETYREQSMKGVVDFLVATDSDQLARSVAMIDRYLRQSMLTLAMDEAHNAVVVSPYYLPIHIRMAEIMMREGRVRNAIAKYNAVARSYMARSENDRASAILHNVLELAPLDVQVRESLIELLEEEENWDAALDQYIDLADTHHQLGNFDQSRDTYALAERIAGRVGADRKKLVHIKHRTADIDQMRLDTRKAIKSYEEITQIDPEDERAHRMLVDLTYRQGNQVEAIRRLDKLLSMYAKTRQVSKITQLLEELVTLYPGDSGLRSRMAAIYRQIGRKKDAIMQLDALGELQLEAGLHKQAADTIRQIITLNPDNVEDYQRLLGQLGG